jgi:hypothetical protein
MATETKHTEDIGMPDVGIVKDGNEIIGPKGGRMTFISKSLSFLKDGKKMCRVSHLVSKERQTKKDIMLKFGMTSGKQFRVWVKSQRHKEAAKKQLKTEENNG